MNTRTIKEKNKNNTENMYINQKCNCKIKIIVILYRLKKPVWVIRVVHTF